MSWLSVEKALVKSFTDLDLPYPSIQENDTKSRQDIAGNADYWIEYFNLPAQTDNLDKNLTNQYNGIFQLSIYAKSNTGKGGALAILDQLIAEYKTGNEYTSGDCTVMIFNTSPTPARTDGAYYVINLTIEWGAYIAR